MADGVAEVCVCSLFVPIDLGLLWFRLHLEPRELNHCLRVWQYAMGEEAELTRRTLRLIFSIACERVFPKRRCIPCPRCT